VDAVPVRVVPLQEPGVVAVSTGPNIELTAVVGADAPIVTVVALAEIVRPRLRAATEKKEKRLDFDMFKLTSQAECDPPIFIKRNLKRNRPLRVYRDRVLLVKAY
jgi:hypothetical protein